MRVLIYFKRRTALVVVVGGGFEKEKTPGERKVNKLRDWHAQENTIEYSGYVNQTYVKRSAVVFLCDDPLT